MRLVLWFIAGGLCSGFSVASQWWFVRLVNAQNRQRIRWTLPLGILLRLASTGGIFWLALTQGIQCGIGFIAGLLIIRWTILIWINSKKTFFEMGKPL